jgi:hypothetical protein
MSGETGKGPCTENDLGVGLATAEPPSRLANQSGADECPDNLLESEAEELELQAEFRRKLTGIRSLRWRDRAGARRELYKWLRAARKDLRDRKSSARLAQRERRRILMLSGQMPKPG